MSIGSHIDLDGNLALRDVHASALTISWAFLGLVLVVDQLLLPMFHAGAIPFKVSYFICGLWLVNWLAFRPVDSIRDREFALFSMAIGVVVACALLGEIWLAANFSVADHAELIRSLLIYFLWILSFGVGLSAYRFKIKWLVPVLLIALLLNFGFVFLRTAMPSWIINLYYSDRALGAFVNFGINDIQGLLELARPRGLFGNPDASAHLVDIIVLFVYLGLRHRLLATPKPLIGLAIVGLPILLAIVLASRAELLVACFLGVLNYRLMFRHLAPGGRARLVLLTAILPIVVGIGLVRVLGPGSMQGNVQRAVSIVAIVLQTPETSDEDASLAGVRRPLLTFETMYNRFKLSPVFGTGFSEAVEPPLNESTEYFHNDWFRLLATSGLVGLGAMLWVLWRYCVPIGWLALIPFVLPGMVNTFMLNIPSSMFYFFMLAVVREQLRLRARRDHSLWRSHCID